MEEKIIKIEKSEEGHKCLFCCEKEATKKVIISRPKYGDIINSFHICEECLKNTGSAFVENVE